MRGKLYSFLTIAAIFIFTLLAGFALLHAGLPPTHDGEYHVVRFFLFDEAIRDGNLYPRWAAHLNNGFGVPIFTFVYPLPNYIATLLHLLNFSFIDSFKISMFAAIVIGGIFFYLWSKEFWGRLGGIVSSVFYTFSPYHFVDIYIRGSVGEVWALGFFPAFLWAYTRFVKSRRKIFLIFSSVFLGLIIFSHNILALMFFVFSLSYIVLMICKEKYREYLILNTFFMILLGLGLSAVFWLPAIYETKYATGLQIFDISAHFPELFQLLIPSWGSGFSGMGLRDVLSFQIGLANLLAVFLGLLIAVRLMVKKNSKCFYVIFFLVWFIVIFYLMLNVSFPIWKVIPFMNYFQFPWRLLSLEILFSSFLAGSIFLLNIKNKPVNLFLAILLISIAFSLGIGYAKPAYYMYRDDDYYLTKSNFMDGTNSPGNAFNTIFLKSIPDKEKEKAVFLRGKGKITHNEAKSNMHSFRVNAIKDSEILMHVSYYPGWAVYVNNKKIKIRQTENGLFTFFIPPGESSVEVIFKDTSIRRAALIVSIISIPLLLALFIKFKSAKM